MGGKRARKYITVKYYPHGTLRVRGENTYRLVERSRLVLEAHLNGLSYERFLEALREYESSLTRFRFIEASLEIHHMDNDSLNDTPGNLIALTSSAHAALHNRLRAGTAG
jgi:UDP-N-acetylmuramoylalanine-D-glutamate ligase